MHFVIDAPLKRGGLRVIPEIPDYEICRLEGNNGIGKTLAVHLLELATGQQPFARQPAAWKSLQSALGPVSIRIENIPDHSDIVVRLDPDLWNPDSPNDPSSTIGVAEEDGRSLSLMEVGQIVRVIRISGDETLEDAVRGLIQDDLAATERIVAQINGRRSLLAAELAILNDLVASVLPERLLSEEQRLLKLQELVRDQVKLLEAATDRQGRFAVAQSLISQLNSTRVAVPELERERDEIRERIAGLEQERVELESRRRNLEPQLSNEKALAEQIAKAEQLRRTRAKRLLDLEKQVASLTEETGVQGRPSQIQLELQASHERIARLKDRIAAIDSEGVILGVMDQMTTPLDGARIRGFGSEVIARFDGKFEQVFGRVTDIQVNVLIAGLARQRALISDRKRSKEVEDLGAQIRSEQWRVSQMERLLDFVVKRDRAAELLSDIDDELRQLSQAGSGATADEYRAVSERMSEVEDLIRRESIRDVELVHRIQLVTGGQTEAEIRHKLDRELNVLAILPDDVRDAALQHQPIVQQLEISVSATSSELDDVRLLVDAMRSQLRPVLQELLRNPSLGWLNEVIGAEVHTAGNDLQLLSDLVGRLHGASERVETQINNLSNDVDALRAALADLTRVVSRRDITAEELLPRLYGREVRAVFSNRLRNEFAQKEVAQAVFDSGEILDVNLARFEVTWRTPEGELRTRPFEAFSSGERAFAYTRARMETIAHVPAMYRVIVLDEFGAFLARDRLDTLIRYIQDAVVGPVAAQVVLVLPLSADFVDREQAASPRARERAESLTRRQYFAERAMLPALN